VTVLPSDLLAELASASIDVRVDGPVLRVTLSAPERRNVQTPATWFALARLGQAVPSSVQLVVLDAQGRSFSAGLDRAFFSDETAPGGVGLPALARLDDAALDGEIATYQQAFTWWHRPDLVSIAVVQGHAVGAGCQLALACDLRVGSHDAVLALAEVRLGLVPDLGGTRRLVELVGPARALDIAASGRPVDAHEAFAMGLLNRLVAPEQLASAADALVDDLMAADPVARFAAKRLLTGATSRSASEQLAAERAAQLPLVRRLASRSPSA
jgi:enoyl-CoA hydratase/carnithine racemase